MVNAHFILLQEEGHDIKTSSSPFFDKRGNTRLYKGQTKVERLLYKTIGKTVLQ